MNYYLIKIKQLINNFAVGPLRGSSLECVSSLCMCVCVCVREGEASCVVAKRAR